MIVSQSFQHILLQHILYTYQLSERLRLFDLHKDYPTAENELKILNQS